MSFVTPDADVKRMFEAAKAVKENSYSPYSKFRVGAAVLCEDGAVIPGTNVENCAYPSGCCAERSAIYSAIAQGHKGFKAILVTSDMKDDHITPCGFCRQVIAEFGNLEIIMTTCDGDAKRMHIAELLPLAFSPADLTK